MFSVDKTAGVSALRAGVIAIKTATPELKENNNSDGGKSDLINISYRF
jgi:hypothetical protein